LFKIHIIDFYFLYQFYKNRPNSYIHKNNQIFKLQKYTFLILLLGFGTIFHYVFLPQAHAYIDPGSGTAIIYVFISTIVGVGIALKVYWEKIKFKIISRTKK